MKPLTGPRILSLDALLPGQLMGASATERGMVGGHWAWGPGIPEVVITGIATLLRMRNKQKVAILKTY